MAKSRVTVTAPPDVVEQAKAAGINLSRVATESWKAAADIDEVEDQAVVKDRIESLEEEREALQDDMADLQEELDRVETELDTARATLERLKREEEEKSDQLATSLRVIRENKEAGNWMKPEDIKQFHVDETGKSREELWNMAEEDGEEA